MKISIKTLQGKPTELEVSETDTLGDIKKKISEQLNVDVANQKLIHYGKVMTEDGKKLVEYGVKDKDFLVLMITKVILPIYYRLESAAQGRTACCTRRKASATTRSKTNYARCSAGCTANGQAFCDSATNFTHGCKA